MRVLSCEIENFGSYKSFTFNFTDKGLALIQGPTGSGKSTLCDAIPWVIFGRTAKGGAVNEVLPWSGGDTSGIIDIDVKDMRHTIVRTRGKNSDLYYYDDTGSTTRGKDIPDTQRLINELVGMDYETYLAGAYYHEFSKTAGFFTSSAKGRRELCEQLVDLSLVMRLKEQLKSKTKFLTDALIPAQDKSKTLASNILLLNKNKYGAQVVSWDEKQRIQLEEAQLKHANFAQDKAAEIEKLKELLTAIVANTVSISPNDTEEAAIKARLHELENTRCVTCNAPQSHLVTDSIKEQLSEIKANKKAYAQAQERIDTILFNIGRLESEPNTYGDVIEQISNQINPFIALECTNSEAIAEIGQELELVSVAIDELKAQLVELDQLFDIIADYRVITVKNAIIELQDKTNELLSLYFDAEIKVVFSAQEADKIDVMIMKDGNESVYTQLSKGQRQLLKLCFGLAVMRRVANHNGISFNCLFLDEAFDGLDEPLKIKAYNLLNNLTTEHESIFVVEHSEAFKSMFSKKFTVKLVNGNSLIEET